MTFAPLKDEIDLIETYTNKHEELKAAHHFLYDLPLSRAAHQVDAVCIGINPGESPREKHPGKTRQETSLFDYHGEILSRGAINWRTKAKRFAGTDSVVLTEFFFWSSPNSGSAFTARFGTPIRRSPHLAFCAAMNERLIKVRAPKVVIVAGLQTTIYAPFHGLRFCDTQRLTNGHALAELYVSPSGVPWVFTKHWSASRGFSTDQQDQLTDYIAAVKDGFRGSPLPDYVVARLSSLDAH